MICHHVSLTRPLAVVCVVVGWLVVAGAPSIGVFLPQASQLVQTVEHLGPAAFLQPPSRPAARKLLITVENTIKAGGRMKRKQTQLDELKNTDQAMHGVPFGHHEPRAKIGVQRRPAEHASAHHAKVHQRSTRAEGNLRQKGLVRLNELRTATNIAGTNGNRNSVYKVHQDMRGPTGSTKQLAPKKIVVRKEETRNMVKKLAPIAKVAQRGKGGAVLGPKITPSGNR